MGRSIRDKQAKIIKEHNRNIINPNMYETSFEINFTYKDKETFITNYDNNKCTKIPIIRRDYNFNPFVLFTIEAFKKAGELSKMAYRLLGYVLEEIPVKGNLIVIDSKVCAPIIGTKYDYVVSNAKKELIDKKFIKPALSGRKNEYNVNTDLFFKGNRNEFYSEYKSVFLLPEEGVVLIDR